jgi:hypothetical protein
MIGIIFLLALIVMLFTFYRLIKWLLGTSEERNNIEKKDRWVVLMKIILVIRTAFLTFWCKLGSNSDLTWLSQRYFKKLIYWGKLYGVEYFVWDTPTEFGIRLSQQFTQYESEIMLIVQVHDDAVYGSKLPTPYQITKMKQVLRKIRKPAFLFSRIKHSDAKPTF